MRESLYRDLTGSFVGCDGRPERATCSFHDRPCLLAAADVLQLEVERMDGVWTPLFHRCETHAIEIFPPEHSVQGTAQALVTARLEPTGARLPETGEHHPDALTVGEIAVVDVCPPEDGMCSPRSD
jgi:hypothetical protein